MKSNPGQVKLDHLHPNVLILKIDKIGLKEKSEFLREKIQFLLV